MLSIECAFDSCYSTLKTKQPFCLNFFVLCENTFPLIQFEYSLEKTHTLEIFKSYFEIDFLRFKNYTSGAKVRSDSKEI